MVLLGVQETVGSNPAVPTFRIKNLRAPKRRPFSLCSTLSSTFDPKNFFELARACRIIQIRVILTLSP